MNNLHYRVLFPTVRSQASTSSPVGEGPANFFDDRLGTKLGIFDCNLGPTFIDVTSGVGATVLTGVNVLVAADDAGFQARTPRTSSSPDRMTARTTRRSSTTRSTTSHSTLGI